MIGFELFKDLNTILTFRMLHTPNTVRAIFVDISFFLLMKVGVLRSKATGEPAMTLAVVVVSALRQALNAVLIDNGKGDIFLQMGTYIYNSCQSIPSAECPVAV